MLNELLDEEVELDLEEDGQIEDELFARSALLIVLQAEREIAKIEKTKRAVVASYDAKIANVDERAKLFRSKLHDYVTRNGNASFPDVGTAYTQKTATKVVVTDRDAIVEKYGTLFQKEPAFDEAAFRAFAAEQFEQTGEIIDGTDVVAETTTLAIRKS